MKFRYKFLLFILLLALPALACGEDATPTNTNNSNSVEILSPTPKSSSSTPTSKSTPTSRPALPIITITGARANIRSGPGTNYPVLQTLDQNDTAPAVGFNSGQTWVQIELPDGTLGWLGTSLIDIDNSDKIDTITNTDTAPAPIATITDTDATSAPIAITGATTSVPSPTVAPQPTSPPSVSCVITASVNDETPAQRQHVYVSGTLLCGEQPIAGAPMHVVWHYKSTNETCDGVTDASGIAVCERSIGGASKGYYVRLDLTITHNGQTYYATTGFTPQ